MSKVAEYTGSLEDFNPEWLLFMFEGKGSDTRLVDARGWYCRQVKDCCQQSDLLTKAIDKFKQNSDNYGSLAHILCETANMIIQKQQNGEPITSKEEKILRLAWIMNEFVYLKAHKGPTRR